MSSKLLPPGPPSITGSITEVFPDIHHKMSKKIAQLTKVIYHLNTKNEDHTMEIDAIRLQHHQEIQQLISDTTLKLSKMRDIVDQKQVMINQDQANEKIIRKHESEKKQFLQDFQSYKVKTQEREQKISLEYQSKYDTLKLELEKMNIKFQEKIQLFDNTNQDLRKALEETRRTNGSNIDDMKRKHELEVKGLREDFRLAMDNQIQMTRDEITLSLKQQYEKELGQVRASLTGDKQEGLIALKRDYEGRFQSQRDEFQLKLDKAYNDWKCLQDELNEQQSKSILSQNEFQKTLQEYQNNSIKQVNDKEYQIQNLLHELSIKKEEILSLSSKVSEREEEINRLNKLISDKNSKIVEMENNVKKSLETYEKLKADIKSMNQNGTEKETIYQQQLHEKDNEIVILKQQIKRLEEKRSELDQNYHEINMESKRIIASLEKDKLLLQQQYDDLKQSAHDASDIASQELASLCQRMQLREDAMIKERNELELLQKTVIESLTIKNTKDMENLQNEWSVSKEKFRVRENKLMEEIAELKIHTSSQVTGIEEKYRLSMKETEEKLKMEISTLLNRFTDIEKKYEHIKIELEKSVESYQNYQNKTEKQVTGLQSELDGKRRELLQQETMVLKLQSQIENIKDEMSAKETFYQAKLSSTSNHMVSEWQQRLDDQIEVDRLMLLNAIDANNKTHNVELKNIQKLHDDEMIALKKLLQSDADKTMEELAMAERERVRLEAMLQQERHRYSNDMNEWKMKLENREKLFEEEKRIVMENLRKELLLHTKEGESQLTQKHEQTIKDISMRHQEELLHMTKQYDMNHSKAMKEAEEEYSLKLKELEYRLSNEYMVQVAEKNKFYESLRVDQQVKYDREVQNMNNQITAVNQKLDQSEERYHQLQRSYNEFQESFQHSLVKHSQELQSVQQRYDSLLSKQKESNEQELRVAKDQYVSDIHTLKAQTLEESNRLLKQISDMKQALDQLDYKYKNRESRVEDIQRIQLLEKELVDKDALVTKTRDEMLYFKREMLNREENYNKKFNSNPIVGVMQVIKPKDVDSLSLTSNKGSIHKQKPSTLNTSGSRTTLGGPGSIANHATNGLSPSNGGPATGPTTGPATGPTSLASPSSRR